MSLERFLEWRLNRIAKAIEKNNRFIAKAKKYIAFAKNDNKRLTKKYNNIYNKNEDPNNKN